MTKSQEFFLNMGLSMASGYMQMMVTELLANIKKNNDADTSLYKDLVKDGTAWLNRLDKLADQTKTQWDDRVIEVFLNPVKMAAMMEGLS